MKIALVKTLNNTFKPANDWDYDAAKKIKAGKEVECEVKQPRNYKFHKKFFVLVNLLFQNQERYSNMEHLRKDLTIAAGYYEVRYNLEGVEIYEPKSISFANMDDLEFNDFYSAVVDTICKHFHFNKEYLIEEVSQYF